MQLAQIIPHPIANLIIASSIVTPMTIKWTIALPIKSRSAYPQAANLYR